MMRPSDTMAARRDDAPAGGTLLEVRHLEVRFDTADGPFSAVDDVSFTIRPGERLGVVGESGSGKSLTGLALLGLVAGPGAEVSGELVFDGTTYDLAGNDLRSLRGRAISMVFQEPMTALDPVFTIGSQLCEVIRHHHSVSKREAKDRA